MVVASIIQVALVVVAWAVLRGETIIIPWLRRRNVSSAEQESANGLSQRQTHQISWLRRPPEEEEPKALKEVFRHLRDWRKLGVSTFFQVPQFLEALVEFQKAQIFFMLTLQVAVWLALYYPSFQAAYSLHQVQSDKIFLGLLGLVGCLPVVLNGLDIRAAGKNSNYVASFTFLTVVLSCASNIVANRKVVEPQDMLPSSTFIPECGGFVTPTAMCLLGIYVPYFTGHWLETDIFCMVAAVLLLTQSIKVFTIDKPPPEQELATLTVDIPATATGVKPTATPQDTEYVSSAPTQSPSSNPAARYTPAKINCFTWLRIKASESDLRFARLPEHSWLGRFIFPGSYLGDDLI